MVLDIGAGTGRIAIPMARMGTRIICVEPSPAMRGVLRHRLVKHEELADRIMIIGGDVISFAFSCTFPLAIMSGVFDHLLDDQIRVRALKNIRDHLSLKGILVFDAFVGQLKEGDPVPAGTCVIGNREYRRYVGGKMVADDIKEVMIIFEIAECGKTIERVEERGLVGVTGRQGILHLLDEAGFSVVNEYGGYDFREYEKESDLLVVQARKE